VSFIPLVLSAGRTLLVVGVTMEQALALDVVFQVVTADLKVLTCVQRTPGTSPGVQVS
jgi:hypothetical protein